MAEAWGKATGQPGICFVTRGPGAANAMIGELEFSVNLSLDLWTLGTAPDISAPRFACTDPVSCDYGAALFGGTQIIAAALSIAAFAESFVTGARTIARKSSATNAIPDEALVVRGGQNLPENIVGGSGVTVDADGVVHGVSVQAGTEPLETLVDGHIPHGQIGVTSVGEVGSIGGTVVRDPLPGNPFHCLLGGCTADDLSSLFRPTLKNPFR